MTLTDKLKMMKPPQVFNSRMVTRTDSYKLNHWDMLPPNTKYVYSYLEAREGATHDDIVFFGMQYFLKRYLQGVQVTQDDIEYGSNLTHGHLGDKKLFNRAAWQRIIDVHGGALPLRIKSIPEGTVTPPSTALVTVVNTDPGVGEIMGAIVGHLETTLSHLWYPCTVASLSRHIKKMQKEYLARTSDSMDLINFQLHDFGFRGASCLEAAAIGGAAHLVNSNGTDTIVGMELVNQYYGANLNNLAYSVPATEHSIMTSMGVAGEKQLFKDQLLKYPNGILSIVIDSYNWRRFIGEYAREFKDIILARNGKLVFRPDSGVPVDVTLEAMGLLADIFGTRTYKTFRILNPKVGMLWGDGIECAGINQILWNLENNAWSTSNIVFGMGGGLLQKVNRDTERFAFKSSAQCRDWIWYDIFKDPIDKSKSSKRGRLYVNCMDGKYVTMQNQDPTGKDHPLDELKVVFEDGILYNETTFDEVRKRAELK